MFFKKVLAFMLCLVVVTNGAFVDNLEKCSKDDGDCGARLFTKILHLVAKEGAPELNIPPIDPVHLKGIDAKILDAVNIHMDEGVVKGVKKCHVNSFKPNTDKLVATMDLTCDLLIKGNYKISSRSDIVKALLGGPVHGEGLGKVKIDKLNIKVRLPYDLVIRHGDVYIKAKRQKLDYNFDILGRVTFAANNLYVGDRESSARIVQMMNENWKSVVSFIGKKFIDDVAVDKVFEFLDKFLDNVATKHYVIEDLTPLASVE